MCVVSMVGQHYTDKWERLYAPYQQPINENTWEKLLQIPPSKKEFDELKKEVEEMKLLLLRAKLYDEKNNEPECEIDEKVRILKAVAKLFDVDLSEIFKNEK